jgi:hypothetical protein
MTLEGGDGEGTGPVRQVLSDRLRAGGNGTTPGEELSQVGLMSPAGVLGGGGLDVVRDAERSAARR